MKKSTEYVKTYYRRHPGARNRNRKKNYNATIPPTPSPRWTSEMLEQILHNDLTDRELGKLINKSVQAIQVKRCKIRNNYI